MFCIKRVNRHHTSSPTPDVKRSFVLVLMQCVSLTVDLIERESQDPKFDEEQGWRVVKDLEENWDALIFHYIGLSCLIVIGLLIAVLVPLTGLVFCCCRCAGRCGGQYPLYDKKRDPCKRALLGTLLAILIVVLL